MLDVSQESLGRLPFTASRTKLAHLQDLASTIRAELHPGFRLVDPAVGASLLLGPQCGATSNAHSGRTRSGRGILLILCDGRRGLETRILDCILAVNRLHLGGSERGLGSDS